MFDFNKIHTTPISREFILSKISENDIFYNYFGSFKIGDVYSSKFRRDRNASTGFYRNKNNKLIYNDFSSGEKLDAFSFTAKLYNITYSEAIKKIAIDFGLINGTVNTKKLNFIPEEKPKEKTIIQFVPDKWNKDNLSFWKLYEISEKELVQNEVFPIKQLYINKLKINMDYNRYALLLRHDNEIFIKVYSPTDKNMKWISNIPLNLPFGINELPFESKKLIITKSLKELILIKKFHKDAIAFQNESIGSLSEKTLELINNNYEEVHLWMDSDDAGRKALNLFIKYNWNLHHPLIEDYKKYKVKDLGDVVKLFGLEELKNML